jgi:hypothetical protein
MVTVRGSCTVGVSVCMSGRAHVSASLIGKCVSRLCTNQRAATHLRNSKLQSNFKGRCSRCAISYDASMHQKQVSPQGRAERQAVRFVSEAQLRMSLVSTSVDAWSAALVD